MLRALKWAYDLGIRQERVRIASHLNLSAQASGAKNEVVGSMMAQEMSGSKPSPKRMERLKFEQAVNHRIEEIISDIFNPKGDWVAGPSIMFPDDKGEV